MGFVQHLIAHCSIIIPLRQRCNVHIRQFPAFQRAVTTVVKPLDLGFTANIQPELEKMNIIMDDHLFHARCFFQKTLVFFGSTKAHNRLDTGPVVP
ncbi:hypothetical protein D3C80_1520350 [compost metagenome]